MSVEDLKFEWECWGDTKPWYCPECNTLLATKSYEFCNGVDEDCPEDTWNPHEDIIATEAVTFEEFCAIQNKWDETREEVYQTETTDGD